MRIIRKSTLSEAMKTAGKYALSGRVIKIKNVKGNYYIHVYAKSQTNRRY